MLLKFGITFFVIFMSHSLTIAFKCDDNGYTQIEGLGWYKFHARGKTWLEASQDCTKEGAHLVIINSKKEYKTIIDMFNEQKPNIENTWRSDLLWLGVHRMPEKKSWVTIFGKPLSSTGFVKWSKGCNGYPPEPNNDAGDEFCVSLLHSCDRGFDDHPCHTTLAFVCEKHDTCV